MPIIRESTTNNVNTYIIRILISSNIILYKEAIEVSQSIII